MDFGLDKIKGFSATTILGVLGGTILPGFLFLFIFKPELFLTFDKFLLCLIAPSTTLPLLVINSGLILIAMAKNNTNPNETSFHRASASSIYLGNILTALVVYISIGLGYFFDLSMKMGVLSVLALETLTTLILLIMLKPFQE